jgi:hypothetical protein
MTEMNGRGDGNHFDELDELDDDEDFDPAEYNTLVELERLESLEEEMKELGVTSLDDIRRRVDELNAQLDQERKG